MKINTAVLLFSIFSFSLHAQIAIGKQNINGTQTILDFDDSPGNTSGIVLPALTSRPVLTANNNGTFILDKSDRIVKMYENNTWKSLTDQGDITVVNSNNNTSSETSGKVIIGDETSTAAGVLVLESTNKAMILPKVANPHINVRNPYPGMMCYDTVSRSLAVYNGTKWSYWK